MGGNPQDSHSSGKKHSCKAAIAIFGRRRLSTSLSWEEEEEQEEEEEEGGDDLAHDPRRGGSTESSLRTGTSGPLVDQHQLPAPAKSKSKNRPGLSTTIIAPRQLLPIEGRHTRADGNDAASSRTSGDDPPTFSWSFLVRHRNHSSNGEEGAHREERGSLFSGSGIVDVQERRRVEKMRMNNPQDSRKHSSAGIAIFGRSRLSTSLYGGASSTPSSSAGERSSGARRSSSAEDEEGSDAAASSRPPGQRLLSKTGAPRTPQLLPIEGRHTRADGNDGGGRSGDDPPAPTFSWSFLDGPKSYNSIDGFPIPVWIDDGMRYWLERARRKLAEKEGRHIKPDEQLVSYARGHRGDFFRTVEEALAVESTRRSVEMGVSMAKRMQLSDYSEAIFRQLDADGSGEVSKPELLAFIDQMGPSSGDLSGEVEVLFGKYDADGTGLLEEAEFKLLLADLDEIGSPGAARRRLFKSPLYWASCLVVVAGYFFLV